MSEKRAAPRNLSPVDPADTLNPRQRRFVVEYLRDGNGARAYHAAGYQCRRGSNAAEVGASRLIRNSKVSAEISRMRTMLLERAERDVGLTMGRLTKEVARGAFFDPRRLMHPDGSPKALHELDDDTASAIAGIEIEELYAGRGEERSNVGRIHKFRLVDRKAFVDMGLKVIGGYKEDNRQNNPGESLTEFLKGMKRSAIPVVDEVPPDEGL